MTIPNIIELQGADRTRFWTTVEFLQGRVCEKETIEWALRLGPGDDPERAALIHLLRGSKTVPRAWAGAWALIEESWSSPEPVADEGAMTSFDVSQQLPLTPRSGGLVTQIAGDVRPRLALRSPILLDYEPPKRPTAPYHLVSPSVTSTDMSYVDAIAGGVREVDDAGFLVSLADALDGNVRHALGLARRLGGDDSWSSGLLYRVRYAGVEDADTYHQGIAPTVKLLHVVMLRLAELDPAAAGSFMEVWRLARSSIDVRLWAELAHSPDLATADEVGDFIGRRDALQFWDVRSYPEVASLRAERFGGLSAAARTAIVKRIRRLPPRRLFHRTLEAEVVARHRRAWVVRELQRIVVCGGQLTDSDRRWLEGSLSTHEDLRDMTPDEGFPSAVVREIPSRPDSRYDALNGVSRLDAIEVALSRDSYSPDFEGAQDWLGQRDRPSRLLEDFNADTCAANSYPRALAFFFRYHQPHEDLDNGSDAPVVLDLLGGLSDDSINQCIDEACTWMWAWTREVVNSPSWRDVWFRLWPAAVAAANSAERSEVPPEQELQLVVDSDERTDVDASDTPVSRLVHVFIHQCASLGGRNPFAQCSGLRSMREALVATTGHALLAVRLRLLARLPYFTKVDEAWTKKHLLQPLIEEADPVLWRAVGRWQQSLEVLRRIAPAMAQQATNETHSLSTRQSFVRSIVVESLEALRSNCVTAVAPNDLQQLLRSVQDDLRVEAARTVCVYMHQTPPRTGCNPEDLFENAVLPFLSGAWPLESHLAIPAVSRWFASIPALCGGQFVRAVAAVEPFLVPFAGYTLGVYGFLIGKTAPVALEKIVDDAPKARALLRLLDLTIDASRVSSPYDLSATLDHVRSIQPGLARDPTYQRVEVMTHR
ncbi:MAG: hypothetical protein OXQ90_03900 [Gammaproteobacteria bacterium]|nr:hypothetical protein [Gammaproteobacteria bacterium]